MRCTISRASGEIGAGVSPCALRRAVSARSAMTKNGRVIAVQPLGCKHVRRDAPENGLEHGAAGPDLVSQGRQAQRHAFPGVALGLAVEWLMLPELLEQDHGEKVGTGPASGGHVERRRSFADLLAVPARELLAHVLDH